MVVFVFYAFSETFASTLLFSYMFFPFSTHQLLRRLPASVCVSLFTIITAAISCGCSFWSGLPKNSVHACGGSVNTEFDHESHQTVADSRKDGTCMFVYISNGQNRPIQQHQGDIQVSGLFRFDSITFVASPGGGVLYNSNDHDR